MAIGNPFEIKSKKEPNQTKIDGRQKIKTVIAAIIERNFLLNYRQFHFINLYGVFQVH